MVKNSKLKFTGYMQNISRSKSFGNSFLIVYSFLWYIECMVHVTLHKWPINILKPVRQFRQPALLPQFIYCEVGFLCHTTPPTCALCTKVSITQQCIYRIVGIYLENSRTMTYMHRSGNENLFIETKIWRCLINNELNYVSTYFFT